MPDTALGRFAESAHAWPPRATEALCVETQGRQIMAVLVHDLVAEAMSLNLHGAPGKRVEMANGAEFRHGDNKVQNG